MTANGSSYASFSDVERHLTKVEADARVIARIEAVLVGTTDRIIARMGGADFFRHPSDGTETRLLRGKGGSVLHIHSGIVSVESIRIRSGRTSAWVTLDETDYDLEARAAENPSQETAEFEPFDHIRLNGTGSYATWPNGHRLIEIDAAFGWPVVYQMAVDANVDFTRQVIAADRTFPGGMQTPDEIGQSIGRMPIPESVRALHQWSLDRFACAV